MTIINTDNPVSPLLEKKTQRKVDLALRCIGRQRGDNRSRLRAVGHAVQAPARISQVHFVEDIEKLGAELQ